MRHEALLASPVLSHSTAMSGDSHVVNVLVTDARLMLWQGRLLSRPSAFSDCKNGEVCAAFGTGGVDATRRLG